ncbi:hypothetical protein EDC01DRAFT_650009 [Geopyxis carbonaria]|nr:hypothetical protein EDC01DRAFT_650009 [Geopyxis carbonaria]
MPFHTPRTPTLASLKDTTPRRPRKTPSGSTVSKKLTPGQLDEKQKAEADLVRQRQLAQNRLQSSWEIIFEKYGRDFEGITDEIDPVTGDILVDNGHLRGLEYVSDGEDSEEDMEDSEAEAEAEAEGDEEVKKLEDIFRWGGIAGGSSKKRKRDEEEQENGPKSSGKKKAKKPKLAKMADKKPQCDHCQYQDELDDTECQHCSPAATSKPVRLKTAETDRSPQLPLTEIEQSAPSLPMDSYNVKKLGSHGAAVVKALERAKTGASSPLAGRSMGLPSSPPPLPASSPLARRERASLVPKSAPRSILKQMSSPAPFHIPDDEMDELSMPSPLPSGKLLLQHMSPFSKATQSIETPVKERRTMRMVSVEIQTPPSAKTEAPINTPVRKTHTNSTNVTRMVSVEIQTPPSAKTEAPINTPVRKTNTTSNNVTRNSHSKNDKAALPTLPSTKKKTKEASIPSEKTDASPPTKKPHANEPECLSPLLRNNDMWAPPPPESDPFYNPLWSDQHPDGTPAYFPPRRSIPMETIAQTPTVPKHKKPHKSPVNSLGPIHPNKVTSRKAETVKTEAKKEPTNTPSKRPRRKSESVKREIKTEPAATPSRKTSTRKRIPATTGRKADSDWEARHETGGARLLDFLEDWDKTKQEKDAAAAAATTEKHTPIITLEDDDDDDVIIVGEEVSMQDAVQQQTSDSGPSQSPSSPVLPSSPPPQKELTINISENTSTPPTEPSPPLPPPSVRSRKSKTPSKTAVPLKTPAKPPGRLVSRSPFVQTPGKQPEVDRCGEQGFKCQKMFCFKCMGLEGEEDDLI